MAKKLNNFFFFLVHTVKEIPNWLVSYLFVWLLIYLLFYPVLLRLQETDTSELDEKLSIIYKGLKGLTKIQKWSKSTTWLYENWQAFGSWAALTASQELHDSDLPFPFHVFFILQILFSLQIGLVISLHKPENIHPEPDGM